MSGKDTTVISTGSTLQLLTVAFVILKLCKVITWSWVWVLAPMWIPLTLLLAFLLVVVTLGIIAACLK